jgi:hypothetical protein
VWKNKFFSLSLCRSDHKLLWFDIFIGGFLVAMGVFPWQKQPILKHDEKLVKSV